MSVNAPHCQQQQQALGLSGPSNHEGRSPLHGGSVALQFRNSTYMSFTPKAKRIAPAWSVSGVGRLECAMPSFVQDPEKGSEQ